MRARLLLSLQVMSSGLACSSDTTRTETLSSIPDLDGDGYLADDCDDNDPAVHPDAQELCNSADDDCDGEVDEDAADAGTWYDDIDGDGHGDLAVYHRTCQQPTGHVTVADDCDDADPSVHPGALEHCNGTDSDCDGAADDDAVDARLWFADVDGDGFGNPSAPLLSCDEVWGYVADSTDCDDTSHAVSPGLAEQCGDGLDNDCVPDPSVCGYQSAKLTADDAQASIRGESSGGHAGEALALAGDVNGDGAPDILIGAPDYSEALNLGGAAYVVPGPFGGPQALTHEGRLAGAQASDWAGESVAGVGDLDGDGYDDLLISSRGSDTVRNNSGAAYLVMGPVSGMASLTTSDAMLYGEVNAGQFGTSVLGARGLLAEGTTTLAVGARCDGDQESGAIYLFSGALSGDQGSSTADVAIWGADPYGGAGQGLATADTDGDGVPELLIGAPTSSMGADYAGAAFLLHVPATGEVDLADADAWFASPTEDAEAGRTVASAGDTDGDGYDELLVGAPGDSGACESCGTVYLVKPPFTSSCLSSAHARWSGTTPFGALGTGLAGGSDTNGDGLADVALGEPYATVAGSGDAGLAFVFYGPVSGVLDVGGADMSLDGTELSEVGAALVLGDVNGDGLADLLVGARGAEDRAGETLLLLSPGE